MCDMHPHVLGSHLPYSETFFLKCTVDSFELGLSPDSTSETQEAEHTEV